MIEKIEREKITITQADGKKIEYGREHISKLRDRLINNRNRLDRLIQDLETKLNLMEA